MIRYCADFETHNNKGIEETGVWGWASLPITAEDITDYNSDLWTIGESITDFFEWLSSLESSAEVYFHNLKFDGAFILDYIVKHPEQWQYAEDRPKPGEYTTLIDEFGGFYCIRLGYAKGRTVKIMDSLKKIPISIEQIGKSYCKDINLEKGLIDYEKDRTQCYTLAEHTDEIRYLQTDILIAVRAMRKHLEQGLDRMTIGGDALQSFKLSLYEAKHPASFSRSLKLIEGEFRKVFPCLDELQPLETFRLNRETLELEHITMDYDDYIRRAYVGGWTYVNQKHPKYNKELDEITVGSGLVYDVNSEHPYSMHTTQKGTQDTKHLMPYGVPTLHKGSYLDRPKPGCVFIQHCLISYELKPNGLPCIKGSGFASDLWSTESLQAEERWFTNVDLEMVLNNYYCEIQFIDYLEFRAMEGLFDSYIDKWIKEKAEATIQKDGGKRQVAKLMLNNLYGKFGQNRKTAHKVPRLEDNQVKFDIVNEQGAETRPSCYTAVSVFVCAYSRHLIITGALNNIEHFCYADTDSLHLDTTPDNVKGLRIHDTDLGAFKLESTFKRARFIKPKCYIEDNGDGKTIDGSITVAGLLRSYVEKNPDGIPTKQNRLDLFRDLGLNFDNFHRGLKITNGSNKMKRIPGGLVLTRGDFEIR